MHDTPKFDLRDGPAPPVLLPISVVVAVATVAALHRVAFFN
jgi:hypothetical protein